MAIPYDLYSIARHETFQRRVIYYMTKGAVAVVAESAATAGHAVRDAYANTVLDGTASILSHALAALTNATVATAADITVPLDGGYGISDSDLEFAVNEMWNAMSGHETG